MISFTVADITSARDNDLEATQLLMDAVLPMIDNIAAGLARGMDRYGSDLADELAAEGRAELWRLISEHDDNERHGAGWLVQSVRSAMISARTSLMNPGASEWEIDTFVSCLRKTDNDAAEALRMAVELPPGKRLSPAAAYAAQLACAGTLSMDAPVHTDNALDKTLVDTIVDKPYSAPEMSHHRKARIAAVQDTLSRMTFRQSEIVMRHHGYQQDWPTIAEALDDPDVRRVRGNRTASERNFYGKFPWSDVFPGEKPALNPNRDTRTK